MQDPVSFGFKSVPPQDKAPLVRQVFDQVAGRYDLMNDLMSGGLHRWWKNSMVAWLAPRPGMHIIDVAGGTGDIALRILKHTTPSPLEGEGWGGGHVAGSIATNNAPPPTPSLKGRGKIVVADINAAMLEQGRARAIDHNVLRNIEWLCADAEALPLPDNHFDAYTIAFGIRNVTHIEKALTEAYRVLKPGGRFLCLEFAHMGNAWLQKLYDMYSFHVIPYIGGQVTGSRESYQYLVESIRKFPRQDDFAAMIKTAGFGNVQYRNLTQGVVAMHSGRKL